MPSRSFFLKAAYVVPQINCGRKSSDLVPSDSYGKEDNDPLFPRVLPASAAQGAIRRHLPIIPLFRQIFIPK
jgi:hypothetical protein